MGMCDHFILTWCLIQVYPYHSCYFCTFACVAINSFNHHSILSISNILFMKFSSVWQPSRAKWSSNSVSITSAISCRRNFLDIVGLFCISFLWIRSLLLGTAKPLLMLAFSILVHNIYNEEVSSVLSYIKKRHQQTPKNLWDEENSEDATVSLTHLGWLSQGCKEADMAK